MPKSGDYRYCCPVEVRFRDLDAMGHVNNAAYFTYFEVARTGYMKALGHSDPKSGTLGELFPFILLDLHCRFLAPVVLDDVLEVRLRTTTIGTKSFSFEYLITRKADGLPVAVGGSTQVFYDYRKNSTLPIPADFRERIERLEGHPIGA